jgi:hypothetical protein
VPYMTSSLCCWNVPDVQHRIGAYRQADVSYRPHALGGRLPYCPLGTQRRSKVLTRLRSWTRLPVVSSRSVSVLHTGSIVMTNAADLGCGAAHATKVLEAARNTEEDNCQRHDGHRHPRNAGKEEPAAAQELAGGEARGFIVPTPCSCSLASSLTVPLYTALPSPKR